MLTFSLEPPCNTNPNEVVVGFGKADTFNDEAPLTGNSAAAAVVVATMLSVIEVPAVLSVIEVAAVPSVLAAAETESVNVTTEVQPFASFTVKL